MMGKAPKMCCVNAAVILRVEGIVGRGQGEQRAWDAAADTRDREASGWRAGRAAGCAGQSGPERSGPLGTPTVTATAATRQGFRGPSPTTFARACVLLPTAQGQAPSSLLSGEGDRTKGRSA